MKIETVAFSGIGAVGAGYARLAWRAVGVRSFAVVRSLQSYRENPVSINGERLQIELRESTQVTEAADLLIIAVKWHALPDVLEEVAPCVGPNTIILSLLNGISSEAFIAHRFPQAYILPAFGSGIDANRMGRHVTMNRIGRIVLGEYGGRLDTPQLKAVCAFFEHARIPYEVTSDITRELWWKLMVNVGMNQVSAVMGYNYGEFQADPSAMDRMHRAQREVIAVANAMGIAMSERDIHVWDAQLKTLCCEGFSSTLQDVRAKRKTEVELYGGEICRLGRKFGVPTPENNRLYAQIREMENAYSRQ